MSAPVTDKAVLGYLAGVAGVDVEAVRRRIWRQTRSGVAAGASRITTGDIRYCIVDGTVTGVVCGRLPEPLALDRGDDDA